MQGPDSLIESERVSVAAVAIIFDVLTTFGNLCYKVPTYYILGPA